MLLTDLTLQLSIMLTVMLVDVGQDIITILSGTVAAGQEIILEEEDIKMHLIGTDQEEITITTEQFI
jgi:hypothetical protein